jgi:hypothetical protein
LWAEIAAKCPGKILQLLFPYIAGFNIDLGTITEETG